MTFGVRGDLVSMSQKEEAESDNRNGGAFLFVPQPLTCVTFESEMLVGRFISWD